MNRYCRPHAELLLTQTHPFTQNREHKKSNGIKDEDSRQGYGHIGFLCLDDRPYSRYGASAADRCSGTAICGGSAIAAVGPVIKAKETDMSVALATIFILNAIALFVFPVLGEWMGLSQQQFGMWAAIAIHDTSSVVGAGAAYGEEALEVATTIKLTRALWIIPLALVTALIFKSDAKKISIPWFILWFIVAILLNTYVLKDCPEVGRFISGVARKLLIVTMFFIGASLSKSTLKAVGLKPLLQGVILWLVISIASLSYILMTA